MRGDIPTLPLYTFIVWCSVKKAHGDFALLIIVSEQSSISFAKNQIK
jgi:hypothetical protein